MKDNSYVPQYINKRFSGEAREFAIKMYKEIHLLIINAKGKDGEILFIRRGKGYELHSNEFPKKRKEELWFVQRYNYFYSVICNSCLYYSNHRILYVEKKEGDVERVALNVTNLVNNRPINIPESLNEITIKLLIKNGKDEYLSSIERHHVITSVNVCFDEKREFVALGIKNSSSIYIETDRIYKNIGIESREVELLIGSTIRVEHFQVGEKMTNGVMCDEAHKHTKTYWITLKEPIDTLRSNLSDNLLKFEIICGVKKVNVKGIEKVKITTNEDNEVWIPVGQLCKYLTLSKNELYKINGSAIYINYYKVGDMLKNGTEVYKDNSLFKSYKIRFLCKYEDMESRYQSKYQSHYINDDKYSFDYEGIERPTYNYYGGPSDGNGGYLDDDFINDVLDGNVDAYWGLD